MHAAIYATCFLPFCSSGTSFCANVSPQKEGPGVPAITENSNDQREDLRISQVHSLGQPFVCMGRHVDA